MKLAIILAAAGAMLALLGVEVWITCRDQGTWLPLISLVMTGAGLLALGNVIRCLIATDKGARRHGGREIPAWSPEAQAVAGGASQEAGTDPGDAGIHHRPGRQDEHGRP